MSFSVKAETSIDIPKHLKEIRNSTFWTFAASEWHRLYSPFVPMQTGNLYENVIIRPNEIEHTAPYARAVYEKNRNYRTDKHPKATCKWDAAAISTQKQKLIHAMQEYVDSGRLKLS